MLFSLEANDPIKQAIANVDCANLLKFDLSKTYRDEIPKGERLSRSWFF